jgi:hypothetical protein
MIPKFVKAALKRGKTLAAGIVMFSAVMLAVSLLGMPSGKPVAVAPAVGTSGWGHEAVEGAPPVWPSPIAAANACGLGASSCFKCHNGVRAAAPKSGAWHVDHEKVNFSCVGCHHGNPRLLKMELAHKDLINDPRTNPSGTCGASCHQSDKVADLLKRYQK